MILVADSSALITLSICNCLEILNTIFNEIKVPFEVYNEVTKFSKPESEKLKLFLKDKIEKINSEDYFISEGSLGAGEAKAIALYRKLKANWLLVDDEKARKIANLNQIKIIGSLGVLVIAKDRGLIKSILPLIEKIRNSNSFFSESLLNKAIELAGENSL